MEKLTLTTPPLEEAVKSLPPVGKGKASPKLRSVSVKLKAGVSKDPLCKVVLSSCESSVLEVLC